MTICDLTHAYTETSGGIRTYIDAKRAFVARHTDWRHVLIIPGPEDSVEREGRLTTIRIRGPLIPGAAPYRLLLNAPKVRRALEREQPDFIELTSFYTAPWVALYYRRAARKAGETCRLVANYVTDLPSAYVEPVVRRALGAAMGRRAKRAATRYMKVMLDRMDLVLTISPIHARMLKSVGVRPPVIFTPLGVDVELFCPERRTTKVRARFDASEDAPVLIYAGRLDAEKHIDTVAAAFEQLPDSLGARLVLIGEGPMRPELERRARAVSERHGEDRVFVLPYEDDARALAELLASADIYVTAGPYETFALSVAEAQAAGLPVVGVRAGALIDRVPPGLGLLGPVDDAKAMAENIEEVARQREEMSRSARRHVEEHLSWEAAFETIFRAYAHVAPEARARLLAPAELLRPPAPRSNGKPAVSVGHTRSS